MLDSLLGRQEEFPFGFGTNIDIFIMADLSLPLWPLSLPPLISRARPLLRDQQPILLLFVFILPFLIWFRFFQVLSLNTLYKSFLHKLRIVFQVNVFIFVHCPSCHVYSVSKCGQPCRDFFFVVEITSG